MSKQNTRTKKHWWGFPFLCGILISIFGVAVYHAPSGWRREFVEAFSELLTLKALINQVFWLVPMLVASWYTARIWGNWGGSFSFLVMLLIRHISRSALEAYSTVFLEGAWETLMERFAFAPLLGVVIGTALAIVFSLRAPRKPLEILILILGVGFLHGFISVGGRGGFVNWSIYTAEIIALSWLLIYPILLELARKALLPEKRN